MKNTHDLPWEVVEAPNGYDKNRRQQYYHVKDNKGHTVVDFTTYSIAHFIVEKVNRKE